MKKVTKSLCLSFMLSFVVYSNAFATFDCVSSTKADGSANCLAVRPTNCCPGTSLHKDPVNCPVKAGLMGGMPMRCMPVVQACVATDNADGSANCLAVRPTNCCAGTSLQKDPVNCPVKAGHFGGMPMRCMPSAHHHDCSTSGHDSADCPVSADSNDDL